MGEAATETRMVLFYGNTNKTASNSNDVCIITAASLPVAPRSLLLKSVSACYQFPHHFLCLSQWRRLGGGVLFTSVNEGIGLERRCLI